jgi:hypothetical protein
LALGYVAARIVEGVLILAATLSALMVLSLSQDYGRSADSALEPLGSVLLAAREWAYLLGTMLVFAVGALILFAVWLIIRGFDASTLNSDMAAEPAGGLSCPSPPSSTERPAHSLSRSDRVATGAPATGGC